MKPKETPGFAHISKYFPRGWEQAGENFGIRFGSRTGAKLENMGQLLQVFLNQVANELSLESAAAWAAAVGLPGISGVALHKRVKRLGPYLAWILSDMLETNGRFDPERWGGYELLVIDGTTVTRPGATQTTARIIYATRLSDLRIVELLVSDDKKGETLSRFQGATEGQLYIGDRGYSTPPGIAALVATGADMLVRYNWGSVPLRNARGAPFSIFDHLTKVSRTRPREWNVQIKFGMDSVPARLVVQQLPKDKAREARDKHKKENPTASKNAIVAAGYRMIITTAPATRLPAATVLDLYAHRWQIELQIKRDKSIIGLKCLPNFRLDTIESWLYAKLILALITRRLADEAIGDLPPCAREQRAA